MKNPWIAYVPVGYTLADELDFQWLRRSLVPRLELYWRTLHLDGVITRAEYLRIMVLIAEALK